MFIIAFSGQLSALKVKDWDGQRFGVRYTVAGCCVPVLKKIN